jgi:hypothetical protein
MAKHKQHEEVLQEDVELTEEIVAQVEEAVAPKDAYKIPEAKKVTEYPGHKTRAFRN